MPDREKIISGLQRCRLVNKVNCDKCPYDYNGRGNGKSECTAELADDVLALLKEQQQQIWELQDQVEYLTDKLKEQEAVEPIPYHRSDGTIFKYECRQCRTKIFKMDLFCRHCGQAVKWE